MRCSAMELVDKLGIENHDRDGDAIAIAARVELDAWQIERTSVDLIVMGSHGRTGLKRALMGSVAEKVVRHARCPVLVARKRA